MNAAAPCVILKDAQLAENIGAVARVMANFGLEDLRLVSPRDRLASGTRLGERFGRRLAAGRRKVFDRLEDATADLRLVLATTARPREATLPVLTPREGARDLRAAAAAGWPCRPSVRRRTGGAGSRGHRPLPWYPHRAGGPEIHSLNLAQAVAVQRLRVADERTPGRPPVSRSGRAAGRTGAPCSASSSSWRQNSTPPASSTRRKTPLHGAQPACSPRPRAPHRPGGPHLSRGGHRALQGPRHGSSRSWRPERPRRRGREVRRGAFLTWARPPAISRAFTPPGSPVGAMIMTGDACAAVEIAAPAGEPPDRVEAKERSSMSKRHSAKYKIDRRMGENIWGRPKSPDQLSAPTAPASTASAARPRSPISACSCAPSRS